MSKRFVLTGGAGFIGSNYASRLISRGEKVRIIDNLFRSGAERNLAWLTETFGASAFEFVKADVRNGKDLLPHFKDADAVVHMAAQVAVTTSITDPRNDFEINALGTFNVLEAVRLSGRKPRVLYTSTNKVYGGMEDLKVVERGGRYTYSDASEAISEIRPLDFHSPYGCSKGTGDQYMRDYFRIYEIPTTVFRMSCIYGKRQFGVEDQGWIAWMIIAAATGKNISIYGDGKQVRDVLFVEDLLDAFDAALAKPEAAGEIFNIGGGIKNTLSVWSEFGPILNELFGRDIEVSFSDWRAGDQKVYISDITKAQVKLGWTPKTSVKDGIAQLQDWVVSHKSLFA